MSQPTGSHDSSQYTTLPVSEELRDHVRVAKAEAGQSYDDYLREHLPLEAEA